MREKERERESLVLVRKLSLRRVLPRTLSEKNVAGKVCQLELLGRVDEALD